MTKKLTICPFCDDGRAFTWQGVLAHVRSKHPKKLSELKDNKDLYMEKFACDEVGNPIEPQDPPEPKEPPAPEPEPTPDPEPEPKETPAPEPKPKPKEKGDPAPEGGLFHRISTGIFG